MKLTHRAHMAFGAQDGAFFGDYMFRFNADGRCCVFDARPLDSSAGEITELPLLVEFHTDPADPVVPHFNAVVFGNEYYAPGDKFPLLYANLYNNYAGAEDRLEGTCCVYRLQKTGDTFAMTLVQVIRIGFVQDTLWRSAGDKPDVRPYGNFVIDTDRSLLHVFTMRDAEHVTRYFTFRLPKLAQGECSPVFGVPTVTLTREDILSRFDTEYHLFIQGACCHEGKIYSSEGFNENIHPSLRVIDPAARQQLCHTDLVEMGYTVEAEWIDFRNGICYYSDAHGNIYEADFMLQ